MTLYVDSSALLRVVLREPGALAEVRAGGRLMSSELLGVECLRTIDRLRLQGALSVEEAAVRCFAVNEWLEAIDLVLIRPTVLGRAGEPLPAPLGTLAAIHLSTALVWRDRKGEPLTIATHDAALGLVARAFGFAVIGS